MVGQFTAQSKPMALAPYISSLPFGLLDLPLGVFLAAADWCFSLSIGDENYEGSR